MARTLPNSKINRSRITTTEAALRKTNRDNDQDEHELVAKVDAQPAERFPRRIQDLDGKS